MAKGFDLVAEPRNDVGKGASRRLRRTGQVPAVLYGGDAPPQSLMLERNQLMHCVEQEAFFSSILNVKLNGAEHKAVLKDIQMHPAKRAVLHLDLQRIVAGEKIRMHVPIHFLNQDSARAVKESGGTVSHLLTEVEVSCLPEDLPEYLTLDIGELGMDEMLHLSDIGLPAGVEIPDLTHTPPQDHPVVSIHHMRVTEEAEEEAAAEGEVPPPAAPGETPTDEGD